MAASAWDALIDDDEAADDLRPPPALRSWRYLASLAAATAGALAAVVAFCALGCAPVEAGGASQLWTMLSAEPSSPAVAVVVVPTMGSALPVLAVATTPFPAAQVPSASQKPSSGPFLESVATSTAPPAVDANTSATEDPGQGARADGKRKGSFLVVGDWGFDEGLHGNVNDTTCQKTIAQRMLEQFEELGDVRFIINVGDSFYPEGLKGKDDPQWDTKWRNIYDAKLRSVPWYSVYGNHDYHHDPCACSGDPNDCAQVNWDVEDLSRFYMPGYNWYRAHEDLDLEVVALDLNKFMEGWNMSAKAHELKFNDCQWTKCPGDCYGNADARADQAFDLFRQRFEQSEARNLLVFSHYPTDYFSSVPEFLTNLSNNSEHDIIFFGGHRHNVDNTTTWQTPPNRNWVVGGGGGWSCDGPSQGFLVGTVGADYWVETYTVLVDYDICCPPPQTAPTTSAPASTSKEVFEAMSVV